jgi:hypothetical protein
MDDDHDGRPRWEEHAMLDELIRLSARDAVAKLKAKEITPL